MIRPEKFTITVEVDEKGMDVYFQEPGKERKHWSKCTLKESVAIGGVGRVLQQLTEGSEAVSRFLKNTGLEELEEVFNKEEI